MKVKKVFKYGTGQVIPDGAVYLSTVAQTEVGQDWVSVDGRGHDHSDWTKCWLVWHYFLVEIEEQNL